jgi:hypothetical protein
MLTHRILLQRETLSDRDIAAIMEQVVIPLVSVSKT